jgi:exodeoxyribonuclease VII small subunit
MDLKIYNIMFNYKSASPFVAGGGGGRCKKRVRMPKEKFEDALNKLEKIVSKLEEGDIPLEESLKLFEEGIRLSRFCNQKLDEAEKKVEILLKDKNGVLRRRPFDNSTNASKTSSDNTEDEEE